MRSAFRNVGATGRMANAVENLLVRGPGPSLRTSTKGSTSTTAAVLTPIQSRAIPAVLASRAALRRRVEPYLSPFVGHRTAVVVEGEGEGANTDTTMTPLSEDATDVDADPRSSSPSGETARSATDSSSVEEGGSAANVFVSESDRWTEARRDASYQELQQVLNQVREEGKHHVVLAAETGSGKTVAFLTPLFQHLKSDEEARQEQVRPGRPRALVILPSRELALQTLEVAKALSHDVKLRCSGLVTGKKLKHQRVENREVDVLIGTPGQIQRCMKDGSLFLSDVKHVVLDEGDTLLAKSSDSRMFGSSIREILLPVLNRVPHLRLIRDRVYGLPTQVVVATATLSSELNREIVSLLGPKVQKVTSSGLHGSIPTARHEFVRAETTDRLPNLLHILNEGNEKDRVLVFCDSADCVRAVQHYLRENDQEAASLHADMPAKIRAQEWEEFVTGKKSVLVCTDLTARGIDFNHNPIDRVINFDFPRSATDYLHRAGRTARAGRRGIVTSLVPQQRSKAATAQRKLAADIEKAIKNKTKLEDIRQNAGATQGDAERVAAKLKSGAPKASASSKPVVGAAEVPGTTTTVATRSKKVSTSIRKAKDRKRNESAVKTLGKWHLK